MNAYELIKKKRDGNALSREEMHFLINGFMEGTVPDYQMAAFLMAVYFRGMTAGECVDLTLIMRDSGEVADLSSIKGFKVDKHSTGGVGDTTTLVLAPLVAASGGIVAKMTGRELGHTGGTVDKLESIPGMNVTLSVDQFARIANKIHVSLIAQTARLAPADKHLYALRNVTATIDAVPLIAGSIMSKKFASGADGIVLDVKTGNGAFMSSYEEALALARTMVEIGEGAGKTVTALITGMVQPLGYAVGNAVEVKEAIQTLKGEGPEDLVELVLALGSEMLLISGVTASLEAGRERLLKNLVQKKGLKKFGELIRHQGGNPKVIDDMDLLPGTKAQIDIPAPESGFVEKIDTPQVGLAAKVLGAGRQTKDASIDHGVGVLLKKKIGDFVDKGAPLAVLLSNGDPAKIRAAEEKISRAFTLCKRKVDPPRLLYARVSGAGVEEIGTDDSG